MVVVGEIQIEIKGANDHIAIGSSGHSWSKIMRRGE